MTSKGEPPDAQTAAEQERSLASDAETSSRVVPVPRCEPLAMLVRRGFSPSLAALDLPFDPQREDIERVVEELDRYAVRLFLRGAIARPEGLLPVEGTRYLSPEAAQATAERLESLGLLAPVGDGRYRLVRGARSFGGTLEWYVARELERRLGFSAVPGVKFHAPGVGGDLDVVASAEGRLLVLELKSSPPKHLGEEEVAAFVMRTRTLRSHITIFAMDTALRLGDKVVPMLVDAARAGEVPWEPRRVTLGVWALTPQVYAVNARPELLPNIARAVAEGMRALGPAC